MKFYLLSDNIDTQIGMRLAGIEGVVIHTKDEITDNLKKISLDKNVGIILITQKLVSICPDLICDLKLNNKLPLIVTIPDRHSTYSAGDTIMRYIKEAIGVKF